MIHIPIWYFFYTAARIQFSILLLAFISLLIDLITVLLCCRRLSLTHTIPLFHGTRMMRAWKFIFVIKKRAHGTQALALSLSLWHLIVVVIGGGGVCCCYEFGRSNALLHRALVWIEHSYISWEQLIQLFSVRIVIDRSLKSKSVKNERNRSLFEASPSFISKWCQLFGVQCNGSDRNSSAFCGNFVRFRQHWFDCEMVQVNCTVYKL